MPNKSGVSFTETLITAGPSASGSYPMILIGASERGPDGLSQPIATFSEFTGIYGNPVTGSYTNDAAYLYTSQGQGPDMRPGNFYFIRVSAAASGLAEVTYKGLTSGGTEDAALSALRFRAVGKGKWGAKLRVTLAPSTAGDAKRVNVTVTLYDAEAAGNIVKQEVYENVFYRTEARQNGKFIENVINANSILVNATVLADAPFGLVNGTVNQTEKPLVNATADGTITKTDVVPAVEAALSKLKGVGFLYLPDAYNLPDTSGGSPTLGGVIPDLYTLAVANRKVLMLDEVESGTVATTDTKVTANAGKNGMLIVLRWGYTAYRQSVAVPLTAAWIGEYSTRANRADMGLHYPASNVPLNGILRLKPLTGIKLDEARAKNVNVFLDLDQGGVGLYGLWTPDKDADGFRQVARRLIWWDVQHAVGTAIGGLVQNSPINKRTLSLIEGRVLTILKRAATRGMLVGRGGTEASRGNGYDWVPDLSDQAGLNAGVLPADLTLRDAATLEEISVRMSNYNDLAV